MFLTDASEIPEMGQEVNSSLTGKPLSHILLASCPQVVAGLITSFQVDVGVLVRLLPVALSWESLVFSFLLAGAWVGSVNYPLAVSESEVSYHFL